MKNMSDYDGFLWIGGWVLTLLFLLPFKETTREHINTSVMFQRTHARLWLLSSSWTVKSLVSSWFVFGKAWALDWISLVVFRREQECVQFGYSPTDRAGVVTFWSHCRPKWWFTVALLKIQIERSNSFSCACFFTVQKMSRCTFPVMLYRLSFNVRLEPHVSGFVHMQSLAALSKPLQAGLYGSLLCSSCLLIGSVWLLHHIGGETGSCWCNIVFALRLK